MYTALVSWYRACDASIECALCVRGKRAAEAKAQSWPRTRRRITAKRSVRFFLGFVFLFKVVSLASDAIYLLLVTGSLRLCVCVRIIPFSMSVVLWSVLSDCLSVSARSFILWGDIASPHLLSTFSDLVFY